jgi:outer membrane lipoprotein-sorting protein
LEIKNTSKTKVQGTEIEIDTFSADYKEVNGVLFPHTYEQKVRGTVATQITISKIETNIEIADSLFKMPSK